MLSHYQPFASENFLPLSRKSVTETNLKKSIEWVLTLMRLVEDMPCPLCDSCIWGLGRVTWEDHFWERRRIDQRQGCNTSAPGVLFYILY